MRLVDILSRCAKCLFTRLNDLFGCLNCLFARQGFRQNVQTVCIWLPEMFILVSRESVWFYELSVKFV